MSFDEYQLGTSAHFGNALKQLRDIAGFVARRDHHTDDGVGFRTDSRITWSGASYHEVGERGETEWEKPGEIRIAHTRDTGRPRGEKDLLPTPHRLKSCQVCKSVEILDGEPILREVWMRQAEPAHRRKRQLPQAAVGVEYDARRRLADRGNVLKDRLDIPEVIDQIRQDHIVERLFETEILNVAEHERQLGMAHLGARDPPGGEIDADSMRGCERGQEIPFATSELEHPLTRRHEKPIDACELVVIVATGLTALIAVPVGDPFLAVAQRPRIARMTASHVIARVKPPRSSRSGVWDQGFACS